MFVATMVVAAVVGGGLALLLEQREARQNEAEAAAAASAAEASRQAEEVASAQAAEEAAAAQEETEREWRDEVVTEVEAAIQTMAEGHLDDGYLDGNEILDVACSPVAGGSVDDLDQETTALQCFVSTEENDDGTFSGYYYDATVNWTSGEYTYGPSQG